MDDELCVDLHTLSATRISVCRRLVLQQAVTALGISMHETTTYYDESNEILSTIQLNVPPHIYMPRLETRQFHGDWSSTSDAAIQSACFNTLGYLQKIGLLIIDGVHSDELKNCQRKLLVASSWAEAFQHRATTLQPHLQILKTNKPVLPKYTTPVRNCLIPAVDHAEAMSHKKRKKLVVDLQYPQEQSNNRTSLPLLESLSSENMSVVTKNHSDPEDELPPLSTPPSVNKPTSLRSALLESKVRKPLFQNSEHKGKKPHLTDEILKDTLPNLESDVGHPLLSKKGEL